VKDQDPTPLGPDKKGRPRWAPGADPKSLANASLHAEYHVTSDVVDVDLTPDKPPLIAVGRVAIARGRGKSPDIRLWRGICPHCGQEHVHGLGATTEPIDKYLSPRGPHCQPYTDKRLADYTLALNELDAARWGVR
jgi:hypothetical protein